MSTTYYLDTSALVKLYHQETGTERVEALFADSEDSLIVSELAVVELYSTVARKVRTGEINEEAYEEVLKNFDDDCKRRFERRYDTEGQRIAPEIRQDQGAAHAGCHASRCLGGLAD